MCPKHKKNHSLWGRPLACQYAESPDSASLVSQRAFGRRPELSGRRPNPRTRPARHASRTNPYSRARSSAFALLSTSWPLALNRFAFWFCALLALTSVTHLPADGSPASATQPVPSTDSNSRLAHEQLLAKARQGGIDVFFVGDSITRRWGATDARYRPLLENWKTNFFGWNVANFGWGADRVENILWRLQNGELDGVNPKVIVVLAGINNVGAEPGDAQKVDDISRGIAAILETCRAKAPQAAIILTAIFPRNDNLAAIPTINQINRNLEHLADGKRVRYLNINDKLADSNGLYFPGMVNPDKLHPALKAYQVWADALKPIFTEILGPPAKTDHAPPPTGDPSAKKGAGG